MSRLPVLVSSGLAQAILFLLALLALSTAILTRPDQALMEFDQPFYVTMAYDLDHHAVLSNGIFVDTDSTVTAPRPGMFFGPVYPVVVLAAMKVDPRFARAVDCAVEADRAHRSGDSCEAYGRPIRLIHSVLLALAVLAIAGAARQIFGGFAVFWLSGIFATAALAAEAGIFSYIMTESITFSIYSFFALAMVLAWKSGRVRYFALAGGMLGLLCLTRLGYFALLPLAAALSLLYCRHSSAGPRSVVVGVLAMTVVFGAIMGGWAVRNVVSVGKLGLSEEYASAALIERFAYNDMSVREFFLAFPFCTPGLGELAFDTVYGTNSMHRFVFHTPGSFFHVGRDLRDQLVSEHGRLDPLIGGIVGDEMHTKGWRHLLVSIPLAWCGMWPGWIVSLLLLPLFVWSGARALMQRQFLFLLYAAPAIAMLGLHALIANHYTRYNLILIGPYALGAAWIIQDMIARRLRPRAAIVTEPGFVL